MTTEDKYRKILEKAVANGFNGGLSSTYAGNDIVNFWLREDPKMWIFNHHFAKAFWGNKCPNDVEHICEDSDRPHDWVWLGHLQKMVIKENPIEYLEKFIK